MVIPKAILLHQASRFWSGVLSDRRSFFKRGLKVVLGGLFGFLTLPQLTQSANFDAYAMGQKQLHLLLASKKLMDKSGMLRAWSIFHYANNGEIQMDWTLAIPPEDQISAETDDLAQRVLALIGP